AVFIFVNPLDTALSPITASISAGAIPFSFAKRTDSASPCMLKASKRLIANLALLPDPCSPRRKTAFPNRSKMGRAASNTSSRPPRHDHQLPQLGRFHAARYRCIQVGNPALRQPAGQLPRSIGGDRTHIDHRPGRRAFPIAARRSPFSRTGKQPVLPFMDLAER